VAVVKDALSIASTDGTHDELLNTLIASVSDAAEQFIGRSIVAKVETAKKYDGDGTDTLLVDPPIISVTTVINDTTTLADTDYVFYEDTGKIVYINGAFVDGPKKVSVTFKHGWNAEDIPPAIKLAVIKWVCYEWYEFRKDRIGVSSKTLGDETITYIKGIPEDARQLLAPYRVTRFGA
jgi:hypothetical protein